MIPFAIPSLPCPARPPIPRISPRRTVSETSWTGSPGMSTLKLSMESAAPPAASNVRRFAATAAGRPTMSSAIRTTDVVFGSTCSTISPSRRLAVQLDVLGDAESREEHELLVDHPDPGGHRFGGAPEAHRLASEQDLPSVAAGLVDDRHPEEDVHERRLAGAVLADQGVDLPGGHRQGNAL